MRWRYLFFPKIIKFPDTKFNRNISLTLYFNEPTLIADGLIQSGQILTSIWKTGVTKLIPKHFIPQNVLILGLGGGSNTLLVHHLYPQAQITAVDIDPQMIEISQKYFETKKIKNLTIINDDALLFVNKFTGKTHYDLVLVDCFEGKYIPHKLEDLNFLGKIREHSHFTLINRIYWYEHHDATMNFMSSLAKKFHFIFARTRSNIIISLV